MEVECKKAWPFRYAERFSGTGVSCPLRSKRVDYFLLGENSKGIRVSKKAKSICPAGLPCRQAGMRQMPNPISN